MAKFSGSTASGPQAANLKSAITTTDAQIPTFEGAGGFARTPESDLFLLAATNMVGEDTFYESATDRDRRFVELVHKVAGANPDFIRGTDPENGKIGFAQFLRSEMLMRSATVVLCAEYVRAGGPNGRDVIARALQRPDEPAELLGYWMQTHGRNIPWAIKRGVADAARRMYNEKAALRYDGQSRGIRMGDVIELTHPTPRDDRQSALFKYLLSVRHRGTDARVDEQVEKLPVIRLARELDRLDGDALRARLREQGPGLLADAGYSWERLSGKTKMDAEAWTLIAGSMGVMALVRNLRNFDQAGISDEAVDAVIGRITDPDEVAKARLFPYQVWAAYREAPSDNWRRALGKTLDLTTANIPKLDRSLIVVDCSGSMGGAVSGRSRMSRYEVAGVMAAAIWKGTAGSDIVLFGERNKKLDIAAGTSSLKVVERIEQAVRRDEVGSSTFGHTAIRDHFDPKRHDRVFLVTDDQMWDSVEGDEKSPFAGVYRGYSERRADISHVPLVWTVNLAGYAPASMKSGQNGRHTIGGFSDGAFRMVDMVEKARRNATWPF